MVSQHQIPNAFGYGTHEILSMPNPVEIHHRQAVLRHAKEFRQFLPISSHVMKQLAIKLVVEFILESKESLEPQFMASSSPYTVLHRLQNHLQNTVNGQELSSFDFIENTFIEALGNVKLIRRFHIILAGFSEY